MGWGGGDRTVEKWKLWKLRIGMVSNRRQEKNTGPTLLITG